MVLQEFDPINVLSSWNIPQRLEAATRLAADSVAAKSGAGPSWHTTKTGSSSFSPAHSNMPIFSWSNTDTYDGIPMICSDDYNRLWNIYTTDSAVSSGESAIFAFNSKDSNSIQYPVSEAVLHTSLDHPHNYLVTSSEAKRYMVKRSRDHTLLQPESSTTDSGFKLISENQPKSKKPRSEAERLKSSSNINFQQASSSSSSDSEAIEQMKELVYHAAAFRPVSFGTEEVEVEKPKRRKNVRISKDPQTVAARQRRERISERIRILQKMVPGGSKMDTASMLDEAANYLRFLRTQVKAFETFGYPLVNNLTSFSSIVPYFNYPFKA